MLSLLRNLQNKQKKRDGKMNLAYGKISQKGNGVWNNAKTNWHPLSALTLTPYPNLTLNAHPQTMFLS